MPSHKNITGQKFGRLTVIERHHQDVRKAWHWLCKCDCGNEIICCTGSLTYGNTQSCGCLHREVSIKDITGQRFGRLVVIEIAGRSKSQNVKWRCKCDCGNECIVNGSYLRGGHTQSCGCLKKEKGIIANTLHGWSQTPIGILLYCMKQRCYYPNNPGYKNYGGRGITVCDRWLGEDRFENFFIDMGNPPEGKTLDRIDNDGNYCKENCRWATRTEQCRNRRNTKLLTYEG